MATHARSDRGPARRSTTGARRPIQARLEIGAVDDPLEVEAERTADEVSAALASAGPGLQASLARSVGSISRAPLEEDELQGFRLARTEEDELQASRVARMEEEEELQASRVERMEEEEELQASRVARMEEEEELQASRVARAPIGPEGGVVDDDLERRLQGGGGAPMAEDVRSRMEAAFGADFSAVRVAENPAASEIGARAYTTGADIRFAPGEYQPDSPAGQHLLAHELTHVVQQGAATLGERGPNPAVKLGERGPNPAVKLGERGPNPAVTPGERGPNPAATPARLARAEVRREGGPDANQVDGRATTDRFKAENGAFASLVKGLEAETDKRNIWVMLLSNFFNWGEFRYNGSKHESAFVKEGDCNSLSAMYRMVAAYYGIDVEVKTIAKPVIYVAPTVCVDREYGQGNIDDGTGGWIFDNHAWVSTPYGEADVLFGQTGAVSYIEGADRPITRNGMAYDTVVVGGQEYCYTRGDLATHRRDLWSSDPSRWLGFPAR